MLQTIKPGNNGELVKVAQYLMNYAKIEKANGIYDEAFTNFVKNWQAQHNLTTDGIIGKNTWTAIKNNLPVCSTTKNNKTSYVCALQILLGGLVVDGIYGKNTKNAVAAYQSSNKLGIDGICGQQTWTALITNSISQEQENLVLNNCVKYLQWDKKWKNVKYSTHTSAQTIGNSGCGTTAIAMIVATWIDPKVTPVEMSRLAVAKGYRTYDSGTAWGFFKYIFKNYEEFGKYIETTSVSTIASAIREGALAVCLMNSNDNGFWTNGGHYITVRGVDSTYIYANDPNKEQTPRKQEINKFQKCLKQAFIYWPKQTTKEETVINNGKIIDISKWNGNVNFSELAKNTSLIIARASCGSDKDVKFEEYAAEMNKYGIPFGVYCYSYAGDRAKARDEAKKMVSYASKYNPLFYVMDAEEEKITYDAIEEFANTLRAQGIKKIGCYVAHHRYKAYSYSALQNKFDFTWIPSYGSNNGTLEGAKKPDYFCDLWQYTSVGKINGISGNVDINVITNDGHNLEWFLKRS